MRPPILLVDDADAVRDALSAMLAPRYEVSTARDADEALELLRQKGGWPVVVSDYGLPGRNGLELLRRVHEDWPETVGLLLTGRVDLEVALRAVEDGHVFRLLTKPCPFEVLAPAIEAALERHALLEERAVDEERLRFEHDSLAGFNGLLEEHVERHRSALLRLNRLAVDLNAASSLQAIAGLAAEAVHDLLAGRAVLVQLWDGARAQDRIAASAGSEMSPRLEFVPVADAAGTIGEFTIDASSDLAGSERVLLASVVSSTVVAARNELRRNERDRAHEALILALASLAEARDNETGKHLERVAAYCRLIAEGLREDGLELATLDDAWIADLVRASALHDIGKVGIPDSILLKPGRLSSEEWRVMQQHAELGARTIERVLRDSGSHRLLEIGRDICGCHHEKWDGSGYPRGLAGTAIPLSARIMALADVYDALTTVRPYKRAWSHAEALAWIEERSGSHFDPRIAASFLARESRVAAIQRRLADEGDGAGAGALAEWAA